MYELRLEEYVKVLPLFKASDNQIPMIQSVIERKLDGKIFADDRDNPEAFLIKTHFNWFYVVGNQESEKLKAKFKDFAQSELTFNNDDFAWLGLNEYWENKLNEMYGESVISFPRVKYVYEKNQVIDRNWAKALKPEYTIKKIDEDLIEKASDYFDGIKMFWGSNENFLANSIGFCVLHEDKIVSICQACAIVDDTCELDVFTSEEYRGQKLSYLTCLAFIEYCLKVGLKPYWEAVRANVASCNLAQKLGFTEKKEYPFYAWFK